MEISIADQIALDDALVAPADRLKIGKCNLRLSSDVTSKEATLQVVYDVLKLTPFYKAFQVTADAPEIYMQEFWASAYVHNRSVRFKMNNKKHIIGLEQFRDILHNSGPKVWTSFSRLRTKIQKKAMRCILTRFTSSPSTFVMDRDPSIPRRNKGKQKIQSWRTISEADLTEGCATQNIHKKKAVKKLKALMPMVLVADEGTDDEQAQDDEDADKNDVNETTQDDEDDDDHDDDEKVQDDDDEEQTESEDDGDDFVHPKLTTH
ncbi:hypothetical protein Tco_1144968 [Tanacetum coccineum]